MRGCNRRKESRRLLTVLISKRKEVTLTRREREGKKEGEHFSVLGWLVNPQEMMTAAPYKTWTCAGV